LFLSYLPNVHLHAKSKFEKIIIIESSFKFDLKKSQSINYNF